MNNSRFEELTDVFDRQTNAVLEAPPVEDKVKPVVEDLVTTAGLLTLHVRDPRSQSELSKIIRLAGAIGQGSDRAFREVDVTRSRNFIEARQMAIDLVRTLKSYEIKYERDAEIMDRARAVNCSRLIGGVQ